MGTPPSLCVPMSLQVYRILGQTVVFYPTDSMADFYTSFDVPPGIHLYQNVLRCPLVR